MLSNLLFKKQDGSKNDFTPIMLEEQVATTRIDVSDLGCKLENGPFTGLSAFLA